MISPVSGVGQDGVDREVAPGRGRGEIQVRGRRDLKAAMAGAGFVFAARQGEVNVSMADLEHAEAGADQVEGKLRCEAVADFLRRQAIDFQVDVLDRKLQQSVAYSSADDQDAAAAVAQPLGYPPHQAASR